MAKQQDLKRLIQDNETVLWEGRPNKKCMILESIFNPMLVIALVWLVFDLFFLIGIMGEAEMEIGLFLLFFFAVHLMPVWIYLAGVIFGFIAHKRIQYLITDSGVYISRGLFSFNYKMKPFALLGPIGIHRGIFDQKLGVGDIVMCDKQFVICDISDYEEVYKLLSKLQKDIHADTQFPNAYRPETNPGYTTKMTNVKGIISKDDSQKLKSDKKN